jgi:D-alanyl-D-alanine carboxypeptidase
MKSFLRCFFILVQLTALETCGQTFNANLAALLQDSLDYYVNAIPNIKGMSAGVYLPGQGYWQGQSGVSYAGQPITGDMEFGIASNTKLFVSTMILKLAEDGLLSLDDSVLAWLPAHPYIDPAITIRQLLNHTSGISDPIFVSPWIDTINANPTRAFTPQEVLSWLGPPVFAPGAGWSYSNINYILAGMIAETASGFSIAQLIRDSLLTPLGLDSTFYDVAEPEHGTLAHRWWNGIDYHDTARTALNSAGGCAGAIFSTTREMCQWYRALFGGDVLQPASMTELTNFVTTTSPVMDYGLGLDRETTLGLTYWGHGGSTWGYRSKMIYDTCTQAVVCGLANSFPSGMEAVTFILYRILVNQVPGCTGAISGPATVCRKDDGQVYMVPPIPNATDYVWSLPPGFVGSSTTNTIQVYIDTSAVSGTISVHGTNAYGNGASVFFPVVVKHVPVSVTQSGNTLLADSTADTYQWVDCGLGYTILPGETSAVFQPATDGDYALIATLDGCTDTSACVVFRQTGIATQEYVSVRIFPNPATSAVTIRAANPISSLRIAEPGGRILRSQRPDQPETRVDGLMPGFYIVHGELQNGRLFREKLIVQ